MFRKNLLLRAVVTAGLTAGLAACGGGSGSSDTTTQEETETQTETGRFVDSAVGGLEFEAVPSGLSGITNDEGEFSYQPRDEVSFKLGALNFGKVAAKETLTPFDLTANDKAKATKIAQVLQTLDDDGLPDNGITISAKVRAEAAQQSSIDVATADLTDPSTQDLIINLGTENTVPVTSVVSAEDAIAHLEETITFESKVASCGDSTSSITEADLADKTYGFIRSEADDSEVVLFKFGSNGGLEEFQNDNGTVTYKTDGTWSVNGTDVVFGNESFPACIADGYLIFESADGPTSLYEVKPYQQPSSDQSFILAPNYAATAVLTIKSDLSLDYFPVESQVDPASKATITSDGAVELDFVEGEVRDYIYFLAAQGKRTGIYIDYNEAGTLQDVGTATIIQKAAAAENIAGKTFVARNDDKNETIILDYQADGSFSDYHNDCYEGDQQSACLSGGTWSLAEGVLSTTENGVVKSFHVIESGTRVYAAEVGVEGEPLTEIIKTQSILSSAFEGNYNVNIPTENTKDNTLVVGSSNDCTYSGTDCTWTIDDSGKAELSFAADNTATGHIWQLAGSSNKFAFLITHSDDSTDIEPGFMTRQ